ncbi:MAG: glycosyltransferase family 39 protein [Candidatus Omnitrophica bacterium]|nr:glycosyltransferase family 39 protein [Candidatus Omnitrophota bacterium]
MLKNISRYIHKNFTPLFVSIVCIYALYLRIMVLYHHTLWADELYELSYMKGTFLELLNALPKFGYCSYLFGDAYLFFPFFKIFSYNKWGLAIPCIIASIIGFYILYRICNRYFKSIWAYLITFSIVCFNATLITHATEIRAYAILPTLALAMLYLFQRINDLNFKLSIPKRIGAIIFSILVIWFHVYGIIMFSSCLLFTLLTKYDEKDFKTYLRSALAFAAIVLCFSMPLWIYSVFGPHYVVAQNNLDPFKYIPNPFLNAVGFLKGIICNLIGFKPLYFLLIGVFIPVVFSYAGRYKQLLFLFITVVIPIVCIFLFDLAGKYWFLQRQFAWTMPLFAFFLGWAWDGFFSYIAKRK